MKPIIHLDLPDPAQLVIWKKMSFREKYELFCSLQRQARDMKRAMLKHQHPEWSEEQIHRELAHIFLHAST
jgi:Rv0078B-related antitoxin